MRFTLLAATLFTASIACAKSAPKVEPHQVAERQVNERLDRQLHATLKKLIATQTQTASTELPTAGLLTQR